MLFSFAHRKGRKHTRNKLKRIKITRNNHTLYILGQGRGESIIVQHAINDLVTVSMSITITITIISRP